MKTLIVCALCVITTLAEPPVDNRYLPPSQSYGPPGAAGIGPQRQTDAVIRSHPSSNSQSSRPPSSQYGAPRSSPLNQYIPPSSARSQAPSSQYGPPDSQVQSFSPSQQYGAPSNFAAQPSSQYGPPQNSQYRSQSNPSQQYGTPANFGAQPISQNRGSFGSQPSAQYGPPQSRSQAQPSSQYGAPQGNQFGSRQGPSQGLRAPSSEYGAPSQQYGAPEGGNQQYNAEQSRQYLPPGQGGNGGNGRNGGYGGDEEGNGEPANYSFEYMVKDDASGNDFGHREARQGDRAEGLYYVLLPDGRKQTVEYEADQDGFKPRISYEDTGAGQGYDRNSQGNISYQGNNGYDGNQDYQNQGGSGPY